MLRFNTAKIVFISLASVFAFLSVAPTEAGEETGKRAAEVSASVWNVPKEGGSVTLAIFSRPEPVRTTLNAETRLEGICLHCELALKFALGELARRCGMCPCGFSNAQCLTGKASSQKSGAALLQDLPRGTRLRVEYADPEKPEAGLKRVIVDRHGALLPVEGLEAATPEQCKELGKSVGATRTELSADGKRLQFGLKDLWTAEKEARVEKALAKLGAKVAAPSLDPVAP